MFSLLDVILIVGVSQGLFVAIAMQFIPQKNKAANQILLALILIACLMLSGRISWGKFSLGFFAPIGILADTTIFLFGPLLYIYVRRISLKEPIVFKLKKWHYFLAIIHLIYFIWHIYTPEEVRSRLYHEGGLRLFVFLIELTGLISCFSYWFASFLLLQKIKRLSPKHFSFEPSILRYLQFLLAPLFFCFLFWAVSILNYFLPLQLPFALNYNGIWIVIPFFFYVIAFSSFIQPTLLTLELTSAPTKQETKRRMSNQLVSINQEKLEHIMIEDKVFTNPELSLSILAQRLDISSNDLSWLLNDVYQQSFYTFINRYRIEEFISRLKINEHKKRTILAIALDAGFNSKSTFNKFFKEELNQTPSEYIRTVSKKNKSV